MLMPGSDGGALPTMASGPASDPLMNEPPRSSAPGSPVVSEPARH